MRRQQSRRMVASMAVFATIVALVAAGPAAMAAPIVDDPPTSDITAVASLEKEASVAEIAPGETFTYTLTVGCSSITDLGCRDAVLSDTVPAPFVLVSANVGGGVNTAAPPVISGNTVTVNWTTDLDGAAGAAIGILDATTGVVEITARLPQDASYDLSGTPVVNQAYIEGTNFADVPAEAPVTPLIPLLLDTTSSKSLTPASAVGAEGTPVASVLGGTNASNATVDSLVIQDPVDPDASPQPFEYLGFVGFGSVTPPPGATATAYEVYVPSTWIAAPGGVLPAGIDPADVRGTRVTFTGAIPAGASASVGLDLSLTALAAAQPDGTVVANTTSSTVGLGGETADADAGANFTILANDIQVAATKSFDPDLVVAGETSTVTLGARNTSAIALEQLAVTEPSTGVFPDAYTFAGFSAGITYPANATSAAVVYHLADGSEETVAFDSGSIPAAPTGALADVRSFDVVFQGPIVPGGETTIGFDVATPPDLAGLPLAVPNEVLVEGTNQGSSGTATAAADLYVYGEIVLPYIGKSIRPSRILAVPGQVVTVSLTGGLEDRPNPPETPTGSTGNAQQIVIQDPQDPVLGDAWWNAFDITAIAQTPVPADSELTIEYYDTTDGQWKVLRSGIAGPQIFSAPVPADVSTVAGGIRFTYDYTGADGLGFRPGTDLAPNFTSTLRADGRYVPGPPYSDQAPNTLVPNCAQSAASSVTPGVPGGSAAMPTDSCPVVELVPTTPGDEDLIDKTFGTSSSGGVKSVIARSGDTIPSTVNWSTGGFSGMDHVDILDVAGPAQTPVADSVYDAFDLTRVEPITTATDPLIAYDAVRSVELWNGTAWVGAAADPCPVGCIGQFPGVNLTPAEQASTTGIRIIFEESPDRAAAAAGDPAAPPVGSGVARSFGNSRPIALVWQVRDEKRSDGQPVLGDATYNLADPGVVQNTAAATAYPQTGGTITSTDSDTVVIVDVPLTTTTDKVWAGGPLSVPTDAAIPPSQYPTSRVTVTTRNTTPARVDQLVITDTAPGSVADRRQDPFQALRLDRFSSISVPAGATSTVVRLFCPAPQAAVEYTRDQALALTSATLPCDATAIQVEFDGRIASNAAGVVTFDMRLRGFWRGTTDRVSVADTPLANTAQGVVADIDPIGACPPPQGARFACDQATAFLPLAAPTFGVTAGKSFSPAAQKEGDTSPITMTLTGQPSGSARMATMTITESDPSFWNAMDFRAMATSWALPFPVNRVQACYLDGGSFTAANVEADTVGGTWTCQPQSGSVADASSFLLGAPDGIHGLRFVLSRADGAGWENPATPIVRIPILLERRVELRTGGPVPTTRADQVAAPGESAAGIFTNTVDVDGVSANVGSGPLTSTDDAEAQYRFLHLEAAVSVTKSPNGDVRPATVVPFTLTFSNTGEAALHNPTFRDELPTDAQGPLLVFDPDRDPTVSPYGFALAGAAPDPANGTPLPTDPAQIDIQELGDRILFGMPAGSVLEPGQTYTITIQLMLRPGLAAGTPVQNWAVIGVDEPLDQCVPTFDAENDECRDDAIVTPQSVPAISTVKSVRSDVLHGQSGIPEVFSAVDGFDCSTVPAPGRFYRAPCTPVTLPGGTETWRFTITNAGTLPLDRVVSIDNLPAPGDQGLIVLLPRGSQWEPTFVGGVSLVPTPTTPLGAVLTTSYSTSSVPCTADLDPLGTPCGPGAWSPLTATTDPSQVRSLKFAIDFPDADPLQPAETLDLQFQTRTTPEQAVQTGYPIAYNTVATGGAAVGASSFITVPATEGRRVGVAYPTGPIELQKTVSGPAADLAPDSFPVQLECTSAGIAIQGLPEVVLVPGADPTRVIGLPWGAECTATEGEWGQTSEVIGTAVVGGPDDEIGLVSIDNVFDVADLTVRKTVQTDAVDQAGDPIPYGPFAFAATCTFLGQDVWADGYGPDAPMQTSITPDQTWSLAGLPVGAECDVEETDDLGALATSMVVTDGGGAADPIEGTSATVVIADGVDVEVDAVNEFGVGSLSLEKIVAGDAADAFGAGPFELAVSCVLDTGDGPRSVWTGSVTLGGDQPLDATIDDIAAGAECAVTEPDSAGATQVEIEGSPAIIGVDETVEVVVTNTFDAGAIEVVKVVDGDGGDLWGAGPFEIELTCLDRSGDPVEIPGGATRALDSDNGYRTIFEPLLIGLACTIAETDDGGATSTTITDTSTGEPLQTIDVTAETRGVTVTNTFGVGSIAVAKTLSGAAASAHSGDVFEVSAECTWDDVPIEVPGGAVRTLTTAAAAVFAGLPIGAECAVTETDAGGAVSVTYAPADPADAGRALVIVGQGAAASVTIDNRFEPALPATGADSTPLLVAAGIAGVLIIGGVIVMIVLRRRRRS